MALASLIANCSPTSLPFPTVFGAEFLSVQANVVKDYTISRPGLNINNGPLPTNTFSFCNISLTHTHPGQHDTIKTTMWLPLEWNGRMQMAGGGGWVASPAGSGWTSFEAAAANGYAAVGSDAGVQELDTMNPEDWALTSPGNVNFVGLVNFAHKGVHDSAIASKAVIESFYGRAPEYSYWSGCSGGGRQGYMFAQLYPDVFDGIAAACPAINWNRFFLAGLFPRQVLQEHNTIPRPCEFHAIAQAALAACDGLDGLIDGVISYPDECTFDPYTVVGKSAGDCGDVSDIKVSKAAAAAMDGIYRGFRASDGTLIWPGAGYGVDPREYMLTTTCADDGTCTFSRAGVFANWLRLFLAKDPEFDINRMTRDEFVNATKLGDKLYGFINNDSPDLSEFRRVGGKLLTWHGQVDEMIPSLGTRIYYDKVAALDPAVHDFYRLFEAPGAAHCFGGPGGLPLGTFDALVAWVEKGVAPDSLIGTNTKGKTNLICPYPKRAVFKGKSPKFSAKEFKCSGSVEANSVQHSEL